jgi:hypothetical protein
MSNEQSRLERDTAAYYENLTEEELQDEQELERALGNTPRPNADAEE